MDRSTRTELQKLAALQAVQAVMLQALVRELPPGAAGRVADQLIAEVSGMKVSAAASPEADEALSAWLWQMLQTLGQARA